MESSFVRSFCLCAAVGTLCISLIVPAFAQSTKAPASPPTPPSAPSAPSTPEPPKPPRPPKSTKVVIINNGDVHFGQDSADNDEKIEIHFNGMSDSLRSRMKRALKEMNKRVHVQSTNGSVHISIDGDGSDVNAFSFSFPEKHFGQHIQREIQRGMKNFRFNMRNFDRAWHRNGRVLVFPSENDIEFSNDDAKDLAEDAATMEREAEALRKEADAMRLEADAMRKKADALRMESAARKKKDAAKEASKESSKSTKKSSKESPKDQCH